MIILVTFKNPDDLFKHLKKEIAKAMPEVAKKVKNVQQEKVITEVYDKYVTTKNYVNPGEPYKHDRRGTHGGLADQRNMIDTIKETSDGVKLSVENVTHGAEDTGMKIAGLVEYGDNNGYGEYDYKSNRDNPDTAWQYLRERPFIEETRKELEQSNAHVEALKKGLKKQGISVK